MMLAFPQENHTEKVFFSEDTAPEVVWICKQMIDNVSLHRRKN